MMNIAITGATGFVGRQVAARLSAAGAKCRCWHRGANPHGDHDWVPGELGDEASARALVQGADALIHAGLFRQQGDGFRDSAGDRLAEYVRKNVLGTVQLFEAAWQAGVQRVVYVSTCAVHEDILDDRPLDERHPLTPRSHYGAHKAAVEQFIYSYGRGHGYPICAVRPCGVFGVDDPIEKSRWYGLVRDLLLGKDVQCKGGGKTVHVDDVARAVEVLVDAPPDKIQGEVFNCCHRYWSHWDIAQLVHGIADGIGRIGGTSKVPQHTIDSAKLTELGFAFGGTELVIETLSQLIAEIRKTDTFRT